MDVIGKTFSLQKMTIKRRIIWIDWAKSVCMFLVVLGHCHIQPSQQLITQVIYSFHIPLFFFLSGLLCPKIFSLTSLIKDIRFIIVPYFIYGILQIVIHALLIGEISLHYLQHNISKLCIGFDPSIGAIWFLPALFICKQLFHLLQWAEQKSIITQFIILIISLCSAYFIPQSHNLPFFADSALIGLPFFLVGSKCFVLLDEEKINNPIKIILVTIILFALTIILSKYNGFVSIAICDYGNYFLLFILNAITGIGAIIGTCIILKHYRFVYIIATSYGTVVTLGLHGIILLFLQYYIPQYLGYYTPYNNIALAFLYAIITNLICCVIIKWGDCYCPLLLGLKGNLIKAE